MGGIRGRQAGRGRQGRWEAKGGRKGGMQKVSRMKEGELVESRGGRDEGEREEKGGSEKWRRGGKGGRGLGERREGLEKDLRLEWSPVTSLNDRSEDGNVGRGRVIKAWA